MMGWLYSFKNTIFNYTKENEQVIESVPLL